MGSGIFHGGFSTLLAISALGFGKTFSFIVFFKTWTTMIVFGLLNGFVFQSVILSWFGTVNKAAVENDEQNKETQDSQDKILNESNDETKNIQSTTDVLEDEIEGLETQ